MAIMTSEPETRWLIERALDQAAAVVGAVTPDWQAPPSDVGDDWAAAFGAGAQPVLAAWRIADLDRPIAVPGGGQAPLSVRVSQQVAELATHSWDLAKATGQQADLDPRLAEHALAWSRGMLRPAYRGPGKAFGAEVPVPA